jgi:malate synthase
MLDTRINCAPPELDPETDLPTGFKDFLLPLHREFTPRQQLLALKREAVLASAQHNELPHYRLPSQAQLTNWWVALPAWCQDQRNQMTGPADDAELVVKMLNSGAPGVMLDLEDSMANCWANLSTGFANVFKALDGTLTYEDARRQQTVGIKESKTVIWIRVRGLHLSQAGLLNDREEIMSASLFDAARIVFGIDPATLKHPLAFYIPKSESAEEARWWRDLFQALARAKDLPPDYIKCMALVESHPLAYEMEEFIFNLREHILGLNLGRWDYLASLIHFNLQDPNWLLPDRNTIPHDVAFFQRLRESMVDICHKHGLLAIGGMTALYPSRLDAELNTRALQVLEQDKRNEASCLMDGAWTGHPDQNEIAVYQFPYPNQIEARTPNADTHPDLRPVPTRIGKRTLSGTRAAIRTVIRYRNGVLNGKGASLLDGYMEDLATDRIYRLMVAQRILHRDSVKIVDEAGNPVKHTPELISELFDQELNRIIRELPKNTNEASVEKYIRARHISEELIARGEFNPV